MDRAMDFDMLHLYPRVRCPLLVISADAPAQAPIPPQFRELMDAYRRGVARDLRHLASQQTNLEVLSVDATRALIFERPLVISEAVTRFPEAARS